uniref:Uncharacterized protein n=1 Tax=Panagrolaimus davidi TaxID=227884 RepID=A0A914QJL0_9BILA
MNDSCSVITFGVGGDIASEKHMQMVLPKCQFLGFDPNEQYETLFTVTLKGKFVQTAVGGKNERNSILRSMPHISHITVRSHSF